jgi:hypothetical protein
VFELLDDGREASRQALFKPWNLPLALLLLFCVAFGVGILVGKGKWNFLDWLPLLCNGLLGLSLAIPVLRKCYRLLREREKAEQNPPNPTFL